MSVAACNECSAEVVFLDLYNGRKRAFNAIEVTNPEAPQTTRWYVSRSRGAVPGTDNLRPKEAPFLTLHQCRRTRIGAGDAAFEKHSIANTTGPTVPDVPLDARFEFSYRWPTSWAHVVFGPLSLCGARVRDLVSDAERRRLQQMHVCPTCLDRYRIRLARLS